MSLTIALDCRPLQESQPTGIATYTAALKLQWEQRSDINLKIITIGRRTPPMSSANHHHYRIPGKLFNAFSSLDINLLRSNDGIDYFFLPHPTFWNTKKKPYILTVHDLAFIERPYYYNTRQRLWHAALHFRRLVTNASALICVSDATRARLLKLFPDVSHIPTTVLKEGITQTPVSADQERAISTQLQLPPKFLLFVGTLEPRKNVASIISAYTMIRARYPGVHLIVAGKYGWSSRSLLRSLTGDSHIRWLPYVTDQEKTVLYRRASAFIWPSWYEGFGFPPLEAASWGTPIITSWSTSLPEILTTSAHYCNPYNYKELADCIEQVLSTEHHRQQPLSMAQQYSWQQMSDHIIDFISSL